jgi:hypothetical protein
MATQQILFTAMARGIAQNAHPLPVSVYVAPRLMGADRLAEFPDWLDWTQRLVDQGLTLTFSAGGRTLDVAVDP